MTELRYWVGFNMVSGLGPVKTRRLLDYFGDLEPAWRAPEEYLIRAGLEPLVAQKVVAGRANVDLDRELEEISRRGLKVLTWDDATYPPRLRQIYDPPSVLYVDGEMRPEDELAIGVVGTRRATDYGLQVTRQMARDLAAQKITVVSGMALGVDGEAHRSAIDAGGRTIAVLGSSLDHIYPPEHKKLARAIASQGAVISEYSLGNIPAPGNFPYRNRIISGMSLGVLIVEAGHHSGALITARVALEQNREVFAVPGRITSPRSEGTNELIKRGEAKLTTSAADILEELELQMAPQQLEMREVLPESETEAALLKLLNSEPLHIDELVRGSGLPIALVSSTIMMMELKGLARRVGSVSYVVGR